jgi:hypothetical protein
MKKIAKRLVLIVMLVTLTICATLGASADTNTGNIYQIENITIIFDADSQLSAEQQENIAQLLVNPEYGVAQANLICNIFGHKNTTEGVTTITHKVSATSPRCLKELFTITTCSRCNESTVERNAAVYISCCPED